EPPPQSSEPWPPPPLRSPPWSSPPEEDDVVPPGVDAGVVAAEPPSSTTNCGEPVEQSAWTSIFALPLRNSTWSADFSTVQPAAGAPASCAAPSTQVAYTVPPGVLCSPAAAGTEGSAASVVPDTAGSPGCEGVAAEASISETARKPTPTAAAAATTQTATRVKGRFMPSSLHAVGLRESQGRVKVGVAIPARRRFRG